MSELENKVLYALQKGFPITPFPYNDLGKTLSLDADEVFSITCKLKETNRLRRLAPVFDSYRIGYRSSLVAVNVPEDLTDKAVSIINAHEGVTHNYGRDGVPNIWFTVHAKNSTALEETLSRLERNIDCGKLYVLPATHLFKLRVIFSPTLGTASAGNGRLRILANETPIEINEEDKNFIRAMQCGFPFSKTPYAEIALKLNCTEEAVIKKINEWQKNGVVRIVAGVAQHHRIGFSANGMTVWDCTDENLIAAGTALATSAQVSHCYARKKTPEWPYRLYAMIHEKTKEACIDEAARLSALAGLGNERIMFSTIEYKKWPLRYFAE